MARKFSASEIYEGQRGPMTSENAIHRLSNFYTADDYEALFTELTDLRMKLGFSDNEIATARKLALNQAKIGIDQETRIRDLEAALQRIAKLDGPLSSISAPGIALESLGSQSETPVEWNGAYCPDGLGKCDRGCKVDCTKAIARDAAMETPAEPIDQAPIARVIVSDDAPAAVILYAPGLPIGEHDLYCEPITGAKS